MQSSAICILELVLSSSISVFEMSSRSSGELKEEIISTGLTSSVLSKISTNLFDLGFLI